MKISRRSHLSVRSCCHCMIDKLGAMAGSSRAPQHTDHRTCCQPACMLASPASFTALPEHRVPGCMPVSSELAGGTTAQTRDAPAALLAACSSPLAQYRGYMSTTIECTCAPACFSHLKIFNTASAMSIEWGTDMWPKLHMRWDRTRSVQ